MPTSAAKAAKAKQAEAFAEVFAALRKLFKPYVGRLAVMHDKESVFYLETRTPVFRKKPMFFGGVRIAKSYVSVYFMPVYCYPDLIKPLSPALKKRMQGKACFNFKSLEPELFAELDRLLAKGFAKFHKVKDFEALLKGRTYS